MFLNLFIGISFLRMYTIFLFSMYCIRNSMKPLSTADFGKVMKQVYPRVRPRRLGTRGNSRYCYAGMRKRIKLDPPTLPKISGSETVSSKWYIFYNFCILSIKLYTILFRKIAHLFLLSFNFCYVLKQSLEHCVYFFYCKYFLFKLFCKHRQAYLICKHVTFNYS